MFTPVVRRVIVAATAGITAIGIAAGPASATTKPVTRLAGTDRIGTSIAISTQEFPTAHTATNVILTAAFTFADAMSAGPLGKKLNAPLLLTGPTSLDSATLTEIERVMPAPSTTPGTTTSGCATAPPANAVYVIGGDAAIAASVNTTLNAAGFNVVRLAGTDRFGTSVAVAQCEGSPHNCVLGDWSDLRRRSVSRALQLRRRAAQCC